MEKDADQKSFLKADLVVNANTDLNAALKECLDAAMNAGIDAAMSAGFVAVIQAGINATIKALSAPRKASLDVAVREGTEAGMNAGIDAAMNAGIGAAMNAGIDAAKKINLDETNKARLDAAIKAGLDAAIKAGLDSAIKAGTDATSNDGIEAATKKGIDAGRIAGIDAAMNAVKTAAANVVQPLAETAVSPSAATIVQNAERIDQAKNLTNENIRTGLERMKNFIPIAIRCKLGSDTECKLYYKYYNDAYDNFYMKGNIDAAHDSLIDLQNKLEIDLRAEKLWNVIPSLNYISYYNEKYGVPALFFACITSVLFLYFTWKYQDAMILTVPLWALFLGGLGASAQILVGAVQDIKSDGIVSEYKKIWYMALPIAAMVFGLFAFILVEVGLVTFGGSGLTATGAESLTSATGVYSKMGACLMAGFATDAFIKKLTSLSDKM